MCQNVFLDFLQIFFYSNILPLIQHCQHFTAFTAYIGINIAFFISKIYVTLWCKLFFWSLPVSKIKRMVNFLKMCYCYYFFAFWYYTYMFICLFYAKYWMQTFRQFIFIVCNTCISNSIIVLKCCLPILVFNSTLLIIFCTNLRILKWIIFFQNSFHLLVHEKNSILMLYYQIHVGCFIDLMKLLKVLLHFWLVHFYNRTGNW